MTYTVRNFKTKKALKEALAAGDKLSVWNPGLDVPPVNGKVYLEGPHYPEAHKWYAEATMVNGNILPGSVK